MGGQVQAQPQARSSNHTVYGTNKTSVTFSYPIIDLCNFIKYGMDVCIYK